MALTRKSYSPAPVAAGFRFTGAKYGCEKTGSCAFPGRLIKQLSTITIAPLATNLGCKFFFINTLFYDCDESGFSWLAASRVCHSLPFSLVIINSFYFPRIYILL